MTVVLDKAELQQKIDHLEKALEKQHKINAALMERVKKSNQSGGLAGSAYALFESNVLFQREIEKKTQRIREAMQTANAANQAKTEFLANVSHELRTPIHAILGLSTLGYEDFETDDYDKIGEYFHSIHNSGRRLLTFVNDLLDLSKLESQKIDLNFRTYNLFDMVRGIINEVDVIRQSKRITIDFPQPSFDPLIRADRIYLEQLVQNLLANALKFTSDDSVIEVRIEPFTLVDNNQSVNSYLLSISDQGIGIPEDELETVFDKFMQSSKTNKGAGGTGLGLAICRQIVSLHHGRIWAKNNPDQGVTLFVSLPSL